MATTEDELPWEEQSLPSRVAAAARVALACRSTDIWGGTVDQAAVLLEAVKEAEAALWAAFREGWADDPWTLALLRQRADQWR